MSKEVYLSLFDGMSCLQIATWELGRRPDIYYASEIDKHAIGQTQLNFPNTIQLGSVVNIDVSQLERITFLGGGSPCQSFSFAGKRKGMATKCEIEIYTLDKYLELKEQGFEFEGQSYLFWEYMRILTDIRKYNPDVKFLLENVEMGKKWERILSEAIGMFPVHLNSARVSAQNRKRLYWTNIRTRQEGLFGEMHTDIPQPKDRGILLKHILETEVPEKYYLSDKMLNYFDKRAANFNNGKVNVRDEEGKATTITASCKSVDISDNFICVDANGREDAEKTGTITQRYAKGISTFGSDPFIKVDKNLNPKDNQDKASCFTAGGNSGGNHSDMDLILQLNDRQQRNLKDVNDKADTFLSTSWKGSQANGMTLVISEATEKGYIEVNPGECFDGENLKSQTRRGRKMEDKSNCLMAKETDFMQYTQSHRIRRLTPTECARLQTIPEWYKWGCSDTQQYRMLGNGWTVEVIKHILSFK